MSNSEKKPFFLTLEDLADAVAPEAKIIADALQGELTHVTIEMGGRFGFHLTANRKNILLIFGSETHKMGTNRQYLSVESTVAGCSFYSLFTPKDLAEKIPEWETHAWAHEVKRKMTELEP